MIIKRVDAEKVKEDADNAEKIRLEAKAEVKEEVKAEVRVEVKKEVKKEVKAEIKEKEIEKKEETAEEQARLEKGKKYKKWLADNGGENAKVEAGGEFYVFVTDEECILYKKVSNFTI